MKPEARKFLEGNISFQQLVTEESPGQEFLQKVRQLAQQNNIMEGLRWSVDDIVVGDPLDRDSVGLAGVSTTEDNVKLHFSFSALQGLHVPDVEKEKAIDVLVAHEITHLENIERGNVHPFPEFYENMIRFIKELGRSVQDKGIQNALIDDVHSEHRSLEPNFILKTLNI